MSILPTTTTGSVARAFDDEAEPTLDDLAGTLEAETAVIEIVESDAWDGTTGRQLPDSVRLYLAEIGKQARLTPEDEVTLAKEIEKPDLLRAELADQSIAPERRIRLERMLERAEVRGSAARERFIRANLRLVVHFAYFYADRGVQVLDLFQEGNIGLIRAVEKFDWRTGFRFSTYATWWIKQSLRKTVQEKERGIRLPVHAHDELKAIVEAEGALSQELHRQPFEHEVAARVGLTAKRIAHLKAITKPLTGIDDTLDGREGEGDITYGDTIGNDDHIETEARVELDMLRTLLLAALKNLTVRESLVVILRRGLINGHPLTLAQTGDEIGVSREMARQIEIKAFKKLRQDAELVALNAEMGS